MHKVVRTLLLWMMLLALPVQGMAQASMFACHLNGNSSSAGQAIDHSTMSHGAMNHDGMDHSMHNMDAQADPDSSKKLMKSLHGCCNCAPTCAVVLSKKDLVRPSDCAFCPNAHDFAAMTGQAA